jgi:ABC-type amino acid transport substrate-binding protein
MGHQLASDLGVGLELVSIDRAEDAAMHLENDHCDLAMSGFGASSAHLASMTMTENYLYLTPALVVPDHLRDDLDSVAELLEAEGVRLGVLNDENLVRLVRQHLPDAQPVTVHRVRDFFDSDPPIADALIVPAEAGSAWTLLHPEYQVVFPFRREVKWPLAYPIAPGDPQFLRYMDLWISLKIAGHRVEDLRDHWILGKRAVTPRPRWSVIRDVLHWVE